MRNNPLLCNPHHRIMITPVTILRTKLIDINLSYWKNYRSFKIIIID